MGIPTEVPIGVDRQPEREHGLGRIAAPDPRDTLYPTRLLSMKSVRAPAPRKRPYNLGDTLDQGNTPRCVGFSGRHKLESAPLMVQPGIGPDAFACYKGAQDYDEWEGNCVDSSTQCLSSRGWVNGDDLRIGDEILALDLESEMLRWAPVVAVHRYADAPYREFRHNQFNCAVTDNHKWVVRNRLTLGGFNLVETKNLKSQHEVVRSAVCGDQPIVPTIHDDLVELVAWACTEGYYRPEHRRGNAVVISQKSHRSRVSSLMDRLGVAKGYEQYEGQHVWEVTGALAATVREAAPMKAPTITWLRMLTKRQLRLFIDACVLADGSVSDGEPWNRLSRSTFHQRPGPTLDAFLAACTLAGQPVSRASQRTYRMMHTDEERWMESWSLRDSSVTEVRQLVSGEYSRGQVWCPQTVYGTFVARRDGCVFVTGNSYEGTSVRGLFKWMRDNGMLSSYVWASTSQECHDFMHAGWGTLVVGTDWTSKMFTPDLNGFVHPVGSVEGGHAYHLFWSIDHGKPELSELWFQNSWGPNWGIVLHTQPGCFKMTWLEFDYLLSRDGEAGAGVELKLRAA